ncbi:MAG: hypothetical protein OXF93_23465 [Acidobacteria bacterium]|nr:hypothetical protein [Acidobacteriota bacterium]
MQPIIRVARRNAELFFVSIAAGLVVMFVAEYASSVWDMLRALTVRSVIIGAITAVGAGTAGRLWLTRRDGLRKLAAVSAHAKALKWVAAAHDSFSPDYSGRLGFR